MGASESLARVQVIAAMTGLEAPMLWNTPMRFLLDWPQRTGFQQVLSLAMISASSFSSSPRQSQQLLSVLLSPMPELALMSWRFILPQEGDLQIDSWCEFEYYGSQPSTWMSWIKTYRLLQVYGSRTVNRTVWKMSRAKLTTMFDKFVF